MPEYEDRERQFDASLGNVMGGWMSEIARADLLRQRGWLEAITKLATPDKNGHIPMVTLSSGVKGEGGKPLAASDITFPVVLALLGEQFAGTEAELSMNMNISSSTSDDVSGKQEGSAEGSGEGHILGFKIGVKVSASFSESEEHKRESDYRATTSATLKMARVLTPEPLQRILGAYMKIVDVECKIAETVITQNAQNVIQQKVTDSGASTGGDDSGDKPQG